MKHLIATVLKEKGHHGRISSSTPQVTFQRYRLAFVGWCKCFTVLNVSLWQRKSSVSAVAVIFSCVSLVFLRARRCSRCGNSVAATAPRCVPPAATPWCGWWPRATQTCRSSSAAFSTSSPLPGILATPATAVCCLSRCSQQTTIGNKLRLICRFLFFKSIINQLETLKLFIHYSIQCV